MCYLKETDILLSYISTKTDAAATFQVVVDFFGMISVGLVRMSR